MHQIAMTAYGSPKHDVGAGSEYPQCFKDILIREPLHGHAFGDEIPR